jgi:Ca2+/Na+ antiporter
VCARIFVFSSEKFQEKPGRISFFRAVLHVDNKQVLHLSFFFFFYFQIEITPFALCYSQFVLYIIFSFSKPKRAKPQKSARLFTQMVVKIETEIGQIRWSGTGKQNRLTNFISSFLKPPAGNLTLNSLKN